MAGNNIRIVTAGILVCMMMLFGCPDYLHGSGLHVALTHHFFHVNVFHIAVNLFSIWTLFAKGRYYNLKQLLAAYVIATISWYFSTGSTVGISNMIFALIGLRTPSLKDRWWRQSSVLTFFIVTVGMAFLPNVSAVTHIVSFVLGCVCAAVQRFVNRLGRDFSRAAYH